MLMAKDRFYRCRMEVEIFLPHSKSTSALNDIRAGVLFISKQTKNKFINWSFKGRQTKHDFKRWTRQRRDLIPVSRSTHHSKHPLKCVKSPFTIFFFIFFCYFFSCSVKMDFFLQFLSTRHEKIKPILIRRREKHTSWPIVRKKLLVMLNHPRLQVVPVWWFVKCKEKMEAAKKADEPIWEPCPKRSDQRWKKENTDRRVKNISIWKVERKIVPGHFR